MTFDLTAVHVANAASGLLLVAVGLLVLAVAPRDRGNVAFALFAGGFGWRIMGYYLNVGSTADEPLKPVIVLAQLAGGIVASVSLLLLAAWFPAPMQRKERPLLALPVVCFAAVGGLLTASILFADAAFADIILRIVRIRPEHVMLSTVESLAFNGVHAGIALLLPLTALRAAQTPEAGRGPYMLFGAALLTWWGLLIGAYALDFPEPFARLASVAAIGACAVASAVWLRTASASEGRAARSARRMAWYCLGVPLAGMALAASVGGFPASFSAWYFGAARVLMVLLLAYAVVRHQLLGIDLKVRWTVKQSTVAAAFVGVFFVASEGAQAFFAESAGSQWVGIAAAGALVFAIAPLQRAAEHVATAAVPPAAASAGEPADTPAARYRRLALLAWQDGTISAKERRLLDEARIQTRLDPGTASAIESEAAAAAHAALRRPAEVRR